MNIFDLIKPYLKKEGFSDEEIAELEKESSKSIKKDDMPKHMQDHQRILTCQQKWGDKVANLCKDAENGNFQNMKLEDMPQGDCIELHSYYFYLVRIKQELYKYRKHFEVINLIYQALHTIIDNWKIFKKGLIETELIKQIAYNNGKMSDELIKKAEEQINKIKFDNFIAQTSTVDFLYNRALKENKNC